MNKLIPLLLCVVSLSGMAADRQFDIELIIFKRAVDAENLQESWPNQQPAIKLEQAASLENTEYLETKEVTLLPYEEYQLTEQKEKLEQHAGYDVLLHTAWRQGDEGRASAPVFHIFAGRDYSEKYMPDGSEKISPVATNTDTGLAGIEESTIDNPLYELDGKVQVYVQHYLFLEAELDLKSPSVREIVLEDKELELASEPETEETTVQFGNLEEVSPTLQVEKFLKSYRMKQKRRMRSSETHYLDHPLMGIVIQVRKVAAATE